jgi:hypothetical protein
MEKENIRKTVEGGVKMVGIDHEVKRKSKGDEK